MPQETVVAAGERSTELERRVPQLLLRCGRLRCRHDVFGQQAFEQTLRERVEHEQSPESIDIGLAQAADFQKRLAYRALRCDRVITRQRTPKFLRGRGVCERIGFGTTDRG